MLIAGLHAPCKEDRAKAARRLGAAGTRALPGLLETLADPDWVIRYRAVEALAWIPDPAVDPVLVCSLSDDRDHVRYMAAKGLGIRRTREALTPLLRALGDENEFVRMCVARSLASLGDPDALPVLQARLREELVERVAEEMKRSISWLEELPPS